MTAESRHTQRLRELETRMAAVEARLAEAPPAEPDNAPQGQFWVLEGLRRRLPDTGSGGIVYAGSATVAGQPVEWQYGHTTDQLTELDEGGAELVAARLAALGSPVRLRLLLSVLDGHHSVSDLAGLNDFGTTGQIYHHVRILSAAGWLRQAGRGNLQVPPDRVIPLLLAIAAAV